MKKIILAIGLVVLVGVIAAFEVLNSQTNARISKLNESVVTIVSRLDNLENKSASTPQTTVNQHGLALKLAEKHWTELYKPTSDDGATAIALLTQMRYSDKVVSPETAIGLISVSGLKTDQKYDISLADCVGILYSPSGDTGGGDNSPGFNGLSIYAIQDLSKANTVYLANGFINDPSGNRVPKLFGPFTASAQVIDKSFQSVTCKTAADL